MLAVDLSQMGTLNFVAGSVPTIIGRGFPFRFGVVPLLDTEESARMGRLFFYLNEVYGKDVTLDFLRRVGVLFLDILDKVLTAYRSIISLPRKRLSTGQLCGQSFMLPSTAKRNFEMTSEQTMTTS